MTQGMNRGAPKLLAPVGIQLTMHFFLTEHAKRVQTTAFYDGPPGVVAATCDLREALLVNNTHVRIRSDPIRSDLGG